MAAFPYTPNPANVGRFLEHIRGAGVPPKVTQIYLESVGFRSSNDRYVIPVLKFVGFLNESGVPTELWRSFRDKAIGPAALGRELRRAYRELFETYQDAYQRSPAELKNFFAARTDGAEATVERMVATFRNLAAHADFSGGPVIAAPVVTEEYHRPSVRNVGLEIAPQPQASSAGPFQVYEAPGLLIRIEPTPENVQRGLKFLRIFIEDEK